MLKRVRIKGFKSFAGEVTLDLGPGLNVIVGPNGSGKSNFAEAVMWALGEQRAGKLRAPGMADVLYQGAGARPPAGLVEVALQFDGGPDGPGPAELEVGRRLTRAGDSDYRVNGASCRLLDVQETLSGRGLGAESLAVIRQGQVEALATSRPAERRAMLDEAAGVAEKLDRARDLATELSSRARALERQARAAERAAALETEIEALREAERAARAIAATAARDAAQSAHEVERKADTSARAVLERAREHRAAESAARSAAVVTLEHAEAIAATLRAAADRVGGRAELADERLAELESRQERLGQARADAARRLLELEHQEAALGGELAAASAGLAASQAAARAAEETEIALRAAEIEASEAVRRAGAELAACEGAVAAADRRAAAAQDGVDRATAALAELQAEAPASLARMELRVEIAERRVERDRARLAAAAAVVEDRTVEMRAAEQRQREAAADARRLGPDADDGVRGALGEGLEVEPGLERAVAGAIGAFVDARVAANLREARASIDAGASAVVIPAPPRAPSSGPAGARPLREAIVACPARMRDHVERLLADAWLVDDLERVGEGQAGVFVNADGVVFRPADGTVSSTQAAWARKALHRRALALQDEAAADVAALVPRVAEATAAREEHRRRVLASERSAARVGERLAAERGLSAARAERLERIGADLAEAERLKHDALAAREAARLSLDELANELDAAQQAVGSARDAAHTGAAELERLRTALRDARSTSAAVDARAAGIQVQAAAARALIGAAESLPQDLALVARAATALGEAAARLAPHAEATTGAVGTARSAFASAEERLSDAMRAVEAAEAGASACRERLHRAEVELRIAEERAAEAGPTPDEAPAEPMDPDELAAKLADLERRRIGIGAVNELAADERAELAEREAHIAEQVKDLEESGLALQTHLGELDAAVGEGFEAIFQAVSARFSEVVELLFPGGVGRLRLVEPDEEGGDEGVEVEVIPAGKRPRALSLMSGGERSLIAMGFCLALAMARPAPFYLLDEVEAALDDTNLRRFLGVVRRLADETQFLVITHQQPTVEVADTLFGVTMGHDGVSQVLSRRLAQSVEGPARPYVRRQLRLVNS